MKRTLILLLIAGGLISSGQRASANAYRDVDVFNPGNPLAGILLDKYNPTLGRTFNIVTGDGGALDLPGYNPSTETITSASVTFVFRDDSLVDPSESVTIDLGNVSFLGPTTINFVSIFSGSVLGSALVDLSTDGILSYTISKVAGDFLALSAELDAVSAPKAASGPRAVPDGGSTLGLLGLACLGIAVAGRKLKSNC